MAGVRPATTIRIPTSFRAKRDIAALIIAHKLVLAILLLLLPTLFPAMFKSSPRASWFSTWDTQFYLEIVDHGYAKGDPNCAFYPLWPAIIRLFSVFTPSSR